jgi:hypothetical protein
MANENYQPDVDSEGWQRLTGLWWSAVDELEEIIISADSTDDRIEAARVILEYTSRLNLGINAPFVPEERPDEEEDADAE